MTHQTLCRVVIAYKTGLLGRGLQSLLEHAGAFEVAAAFGADEGLTTFIRDHAPDAIIVESGALSPENAQAVLNTALTHPNMSVVSVSLDEAKPTLFRGLSVAAEGNETVADALRRHLTVPAGSIRESGTSPVDVVAKPPAAPVPEGRARRRPHGSPHREEYRS